MTDKMQTITHLFPPSTYSDTPQGDRKWAGWWLSLVEKAVNDGLPKCYGDDLASWLADRWADLPWTPERGVRVWQQVKEDARFDDICKRFIARFGEPFFTEEPEA